MIATFLPEQSATTLNNNRNVTANNVTCCIKTTHINTLYYNISVISVPVYTALLQTALAELYTTVIFPVKLLSSNYPVSAHNTRHTRAITYTKSLFRFTKEILVKITKPPKG